MFFAFYAFLHVFIFIITFEPNKIQACLAPQNDRLNLSFVREFHVVGKKMTKNSQKMAIFES